MQIKWNGKYTTIAVYSCAVAAVMIVIFAAFINFGALCDVAADILDILSPIIIGAVIAYILNPLYRKLRESKLLCVLERKKPRPGAKKVVAIVLTYLTVILALCVFVWLFVPQLVLSYNELTGKAATYVAELKPRLDGAFADKGRLTSLCEELVSKLDVNYILDKLRTWLIDSLELLFSGAKTLVGTVMSVVTQVKNILFGFIISIYMLVSKERLASKSKKLLSALTTDERAARIIEICRKSDHAFGSFIVGKITDSLIVGAIFLAVLWIFGIPYAPLISVILAVTNVIPYFGPFLGAIPSALIIFVSSPVKTVVFIIITIVVQQLDANIIEPKIVGDSVGLDRLSVVVAIVLMSGFFGFVGLLIGVPLYAVIYSLFKEWVEKRLARRGLSADTADYLKKEDAE